MHNPSESVAHTPYDDHRDKYCEIILFSITITSPEAMLLQFLKVWLYFLMHFKL